MQNAQLIQFVMICHHIHISDKIDNPRASNLELGTTEREKAACKTRQSRSGVRMTRQENFIQRSKKVGVDDQMVYFKACQPHRLYPFQEIDTRIK